MILNINIRNSWDKENYQQIITYCFELAQSEILIGQLLRLE